jgi:hypothetical protein
MLLNTLVTLFIMTAIIIRAKNLASRLLAIIGGSVIVIMTILVELAGRGILRGNPRIIFNINSIAGITGLFLFGLAILLARLNKKTDTVKQDVPNSSLDKESMQALSKKDAPIWVGFILAGAALLFGLIDVFTQGGYGPRQQTWSSIFNLAYAVYFLVCLFQLHNRLQTATKGAYPISPGKAVGFHFIPFYNFYWIFKWPAEITKFINTQAKSKRYFTGMGGLCILGALLVGLIPIPTGGRGSFIMLGGFIYGFVLFGVLYYLDNKLRYYASCPDNISWVKEEA